MIYIVCKKCKKEFKVSGADLEERRKNKIPDLCRVCEKIPKKGVADKPVKIKEKKTLKKKGK